MPKIPSSVARLRHAVRRGLEDLPRGSVVAVACSGGPDSLALADALAFVGPRRGWTTALATVDHGLQEGSDARAADVVDWAKETGFDHARTLRVEPGRFAGGPEASARDARYEALNRQAAEWGTAAVLLGHTRDDQAETVLLGLARGSGPRGLAGMRARRGVYRRPILDLPRETTHDYCLQRGLDPWIDPHNSDSRFKRSALREAMDTLTAVLGHGLVANLARTAGQVAADVDFTDALAAERYAEMGSPSELPAADLEGLPEALRTRLERLWLLDQGLSAAGLTHRHLAAVDALVVDWSGQGPAALPGGLVVARKKGLLTCSRP
ncbi:tRNA lysidine(34) synthetase TilS [Salininema proteolyticum]|uniref:tRNA(Ile)-lysidine synthase n=1 Tax=Salininema proteolyticum TaxID=1607685 RepID=A0ABV8U5W1_9ACTN